MKSIANFGNQSAGIPIVADDVLELHAARLLLLFRLCGVHGARIDGLTKMAKLDFFVRYPQFFDQVCIHLKVPVERQYRTVESSMVRFHYGPWDQRYYHVLAYLEGKRLVVVSKAGRAFQFELTDQGKRVADVLLVKPAFKPLADQMTRVRSVLGQKTGTALKKLIYLLFQDEVTVRTLGEVIG